MKFPAVVDFRVLRGDDKDVSTLVRQLFWEGIDIDRAEIDFFGVSGPPFNDRLVGILHFNLRFGHQAILIFVRLVVSSGDVDPRQAFV
jgi:hypothetical protein